jgi:hypothetical protein
VLGLEIDFEAAIVKTQDLLSLIRYRYELSDPAGRGFMMFHTLTNIGEHMW